MASTAHRPLIKTSAQHSLGTKPRLLSHRLLVTAVLISLLFPSSMLPRLATDLGVSTVGEIHDPLEDLLGVEPSPWTPRWENLMGLEDSPKRASLLWIVGSSGPS